MRSQSDDLDFFQTLAGTILSESNKQTKTDKQIVRFTIQNIIGGCIYRKVIFQIGDARYILNKSKCSLYS